MIEFPLALPVTNLDIWLLILQWIEYQNYKHALVTFFFLFWLEDEDHSFVFFCSISNLGMYPVDQFCAIINPPQVLSLSHFLSLSVSQPHAYTLMHTSTCHYTCIKQLKMHKTLCLLVLVSSYTTNDSVC